MSLLPEPSPRHDAPQASTEVASEIASEATLRPAIHPDLTYALFTATCGGHLDDALAALQQGASATQPDTDGYLPLSFAVVNNRLDIIDLLMAHGADPTVYDDGGLCPLILASELDHAYAVDRMLVHLGVEARDVAPRTLRPVRT